MDRELVQFLSFLVIDYLRKEINPTLNLLEIKREEDDVILFQISEHKRVICEIAMEAKKPKFITYSLFRNSYRYQAKMLGRLFSELNFGTAEEYEKIRKF